MMKRILLLAISLNMIAMQAQMKPAVEPDIARVDYRPIPFPERFNHCKPAKNLSDPLTWQQLTNGFQQVVGGIRDAVTDKRIYGPLSNMASAAKENLVAGAQKIGDVGSRMTGYLTVKAKDLSDSVSGIVKLAMNGGADSDKRINAWRSGFENAREQHAQRIRPGVIPDGDTVALQVTEQETETKDESVPVPEELPVSVEPIAVEQPPEEPMVTEPEQPVVTEQTIITEEAILPEQTEPEAAPAVEPESVAPPVQEPQESLPVQAIQVEEIKEPVQEPEPVIVQETVPVQPLPPVPVAPIIQPVQSDAVVTPKEVPVHEPTVIKEELPELQEASKTILEKEEYRPVRKKRRPVENEEAIDLFDVQSAFARPEPYPNYQPSPFMNVSQPMPMYQQQMPMMVQQQPMPVMGYQFNQNPLNSVAMQMQSSAMAMQAQANMLMAQAQQQPSMQWQQPYQQVYTRPSSMRENTKQEKATLGMQAIQQVINAGEGAAQHLLHILDLEFDILEHLLAGNVGQRVDSALRERNSAIKNSNPMVVTAYDRLMELATTYGNDDDIGARLYHYCVRKSKRVMKSPMISQAKKKFLLHMMCVLEQYYEIIEKMLRVANLKY